MSKLSEWMNKRQAEHGTPSPSITAKYPVSVEQNIPVAGFNVTSGMRYRWTVTDRTTGRVIHTGYSFTTAASYREADAWLAAQERKGKL